MDVLLLCTANQCRSPMGEVLLRRHLAARGVTATVSSAGLLEGGRPAAAGARRAVAARGLDLEAHTSRRVTPELLRAADVVLTMERRHVQAAVLLEPASWPVSFALRDLLRAAERPARPAPLLGRLAVLHAGRRPADLVRGDGAGDVRDPMGGRDRDFREVADQLDDLLGRFADLVAGAPDDRAAPAAEAPAVGRTRWWRR